MGFVYYGASIECNSALVISRDIKATGLVNLPNVGRCRKYNCKRNSEASIKEESIPKEKIYYPTPHLDLNSQIKGEDIIFYTKTVKQIKKEVVNFTGRHKTQKTITNCFTLAEITLQFPNIKSISDPKQIAPEQKKLTSK
jgi:hypothetical protein